MNAPPKKLDVKVKAPVRKTGRKPSVAEMNARITARFPKTIVRLGE